MAVYIAGTSGGPHHKTCEHPSQGCCTSFPTVVSSPQNPPHHLSNHITYKQMNLVDSYESYRNPMCELREQ